MLINTLISPTNTEVFGSSNTDASSYTTATVGAVQAAQQLLVVVVGNTHASAASAPTIAGNTGLAGLTFTQRVTQLQGNGTQRITMFTSLVPSDLTDGTLTISFGGVTQTGCEWSLVAVEGGYDVTKDWSAPLAPSGGGSNTASAASSGTATSITPYSLPTTPTDGNLVVMGVRHPANEGTTKKATGNWLEIHDINHTLPNGDMETQYSPDPASATIPDDTPGASWTTATVWVSVAMELRPAIAAAANTPPRIITRAAVLRASVR